MWFGENNREASRILEGCEARIRLVFTPSHRGWNNELTRCASFSLKYFVDGMQFPQFLREGITPKGRLL